MSYTPGHEALQIATKHMGDRFVKSNCGHTSQESGDLKTFCFVKPMDFHGFVRIPLGGGHAAFSALTSEDGARYFRDIGKYTKYSRLGNVVNVEYTSVFGTTSQDMIIGYRRITFTGNGPLGITFGGSWTHLSDGIHLEQTVWGIPRFMGGIVQKRVDRALQDILTVES